VPSVVVPIARDLDNVSTTKLEEPRVEEGGESAYFIEARTADSRGMLLYGKIWVVGYGCPMLQSASTSMTRNTFLVCCGANVERKGFVIVKRR
jgi:hypothetical protein